MYADIFGTLPIAEALVMKGVGLGTVLAFMMAVTALSLPSLILLRKVVKPKLLGIFVGIVVTGIIDTRRKTMEIKVLGSGCPNCKRLEKNVREAAIALGIDANITKVTDYSEIVSYGVMRTPALVVDGEVLISGQVPSPERLQEYLKDAD